MAEVVSKRRHNFRTKRFQRNTHNTYVEISTESLMTPDFHRIIEVLPASAVTDTQNDYRNPRACAEG